MPKSGYVIRRADDKSPPVDDAIDAGLRDDVFPCKAEMPDEIG